MSRFESTQSSLRIGDSVLFLISSRGYIYSELTSSAYNFLTVYPVEGGSEAQPDFPNVSFAAFKIIAPNKYKDREYYEELKKKSEKLSPDDLHKLFRAKKAAESEDLENDNEQQRRLGTKVVYGDVIQLQHVGSGNYVTVRSEAAKTETNNLLVNLTKLNSDECRFKILPRYKVRSEGDEVRYNDQMKIESIKTPGQYLNCSARHNTLKSAGFSTNPQFFELNLSATESALALLPHHTLATKHPKKSLRAGSCIRLFHREDECYIAAEGSFANQGSVIYENVHCRQRRVDQRRHINPSTSANTYWQIEKGEDPKTGEVLYWEERCRLKHLPTRLYLAVCKNGLGQWEVTLKPRSFDEENDRATLFSFHPLIEEGIEVLLESYARIEHISSGQWLHLDDNPYDRENFKPDATKGLAGLEWDTAKLYKLSMSANKEDYDAFTLQEVPIDLVVKFNYVAGIVPILSSHIQLLHSGEKMSLKQYSHVKGTSVEQKHVKGTIVEQKHLGHVKNALAELGDWLVTDNDRETKNNQKLLRNLQVIEQLAEILKSSPITIYQHIEICRESYNVIQKFLEGDSRKNENYLARYIEFFQTHVRKGLNAEEVLVEIVQDNLAIVTTMADTRMQMMIDQFHDTKDVRFLEFLSSLCVCSGRPIPSTQNRLLEELVIKHGRELLLRTSLRRNPENNTDEVVYCKPRSVQPISLHQLKPVTDKRQSYGEEKNDYELMKSQLHLFANMCKGNNKNIIDSLVRTPDNKDGYISFSEALICAEDYELDTEIRSHYVELILVMFVDVGDNRPFMDHLCYSFIYNDLVPEPYSESGGDDAEALTGVLNLHFTDMKNWLLRAIKSYKKNKKHYTSEIKKNEMFAQVLDVLGYLVRFGYYDSEDDIDEIIKPLIGVLDGKTDFPKTENEEESSERKKDSHENKAIFAVKMKALEVMELFFKFKFYVILQKFMNDFKVLNGAGRKAVGTTSTSRSLPPSVLRRLWVNVDPTLCHEWLHSPEMANSAKERLQFLCQRSINGSTYNLDSILLDLSEYECDELVTSSLNLLTQMYFFEEELFSKAHQAQLLISEASIAHYKLVDTPLLPQLRQLFRIDPDERNQRTLRSILDQLSDLLVEPGLNGEPNKDNQIMLDNFGILDDILSYILSNDGSSSGITIQTSVLQKCFNLLCCLANGYKNVQTRLFNRIDDLLSIRVPTVVLKDLADLILEIFSGGAELVMKVAESHITQIFEIAVNCKNATVQAHFMIALEAIAKIEEQNLPVRKNQALIVKNFCRCRDKFCKELLDVGSADKRLNILKDKSDPQLQLLLSITDMLAGCAEGKNLFIESVCQNIFTVEELVRIISNDLPPVHKRPFVRFLNQVYMSTDRSKPNNGGIVISHDGAMWSYLEHLAELLINISNALSHADDKSIRQRLFSKPNRHSLISTHQTLAKTISSSKMPSVAGEDVDPGLLEYLLTAVLPLLHSFYTVYFKPGDIPNQQQRDIQYNISAKIAKNLIILRKEFLKFITSPEQVVLFREIILSLCLHQEILELANIDSKIISSLSEFKLDPQPDVSQKSNEQTQTNECFHMFVTNYELVYKGLNTASYQIGSPVPKIKYSNPGEELPLSPKFQDLVNLYYSNSADGSNPVRSEAEILLKKLQISASQTEQLNEKQQISQDKLDVRCLQVLRALVHNRIVLIDPELKESDAIKYSNLSDELFVPVQDQIQKFCGNAIEKIIPLLSHTNESISREALALMKALLFSGNENVQEGLASSVQETREETLFVNLKERLENAGTNYTEIRDLQLQLVNKKTFRAVTAHAADKATLKLSLGRQVSISIDEDESSVKYLPAQETSFIRQSVYSSNSEKAKTSEQPSEEEDDFASQLLVSNANSTCLVLEVIGLMCDGQNRTLQNYLREQPDNFKTVNVVAEVTSLLHTYTTDITRDNIGQIPNIVQALIEMCVGNTKNQNIIFHKLVTEPLNKILQIPLTKKDRCEDCSHQDLDSCSDCTYLLDLVKVKGSVVELIDAMLENTSTQTEEIIEGIGSTVDIDALVDTMSLFYELQSHPLIRDEEMDDDCQRGMFRAYHTLVTLVENEAIPLKSEKGYFLDEVKARCKHCEDTFDECHKASHTIEIHYKGSDSKPLLAKVHFPYESENELREEVKELVRWNINRDSMEDKQRALLDLMPSLKKDIKHQEKLKSVKVLKPFLAFYIYRTRFLMLLTVLLNLFVLFLYNTTVGKPMYFFYNTTRLLQPSLEIWFSSYLLNILGAIHLFMSIWIVIEYFVINWPHFKLPSFCYEIWHYIKRLTSRTSERNFTHSESCIDVKIFGVSTLYMIVFLCCSILSFVFSGYFYCICLLFIIVNNDILKRVLRAVTKNGISLVWVALLGLVMLFIYAVISFAFLHNFFIVYDDAALYCASLLQCAYSVMRYGLIDNIGLLVPFTSNSSSASLDNFSNELHLPRLIFDLSFFIIITTIGLNIVFGIIVDTFSELREERSNVEADQKSLCFICDIPNHEFERKSKGFRLHVKEDHNMWNYVYYSLYIDNIDTGDHNAIQKYVYELIADKQTSFFPQKEACCLPDEEDVTGQLIEGLIDKVDYVVKHFKEKEVSKTVLAKKEKHEKWKRKFLERSQTQRDSQPRSFSLEEDH